MIDRRLFCKAVGSMISAAALPYRNVADIILHKGSIQVQVCLLDQSGARVSDFISCRFVADGKDEFGNTNWTNQDQLLFSNMRKCTVTRVRVKVDELGQQKDIPLFCMAG